MVHLVIGLALTALDQQIKSRILLIMPGGGDIDRAQRRIQELGLTSSVLVPGPVSDSARNDLLRGADIFVLPSYAEGQPIAILEAMAVPKAVKNIAVKII